mmetsp:Transcript_43469/g.81065  ORF Transcript_43469/g.81065 Transcript_43469/m.81065 type:complete len:318 (+) Transcript_43469:70-1023(+)
MAFAFMQMGRVLLTASCAVLSFAEGDVCSTAVGASSASLYQTAAKPLAAVQSPGFTGLLNDVPDDELLSDVEGTFDVDIETIPSQPEAPLQGLALLAADLKWIWKEFQQIRNATASCNSHTWSIVLAWATALVSFGLTRSLLSGKGPEVPAEKVIDEVTDKLPQQGTEEIEDQHEEDAAVDVDAGEVKPVVDVTNPVYIQRATEQQEEAAKRAIQIKNAQRDHRDVFGCSALHLAAHNCYPEDAEQLVLAGFDLNAHDHSGETPLHMAARSGCRKTVLLLLKYGADPARRNSFGKTPCEVAMRRDRALAALLREACV